MCLQHIVRCIQKDHLELKLKHLSFGFCCNLHVLTLTTTEDFTTHGVCTHHCAGFQHFLHLVHHGKAVGGHTGVGWGTGRAGPWARGLPQGGAEDGGCPDLRRPHWSHRGHGEIGGSCLHGKKKRGGKNTALDFLKIVLLYCTTTKTQAHKKTP